MEPSSELESDPEPADVQALPGCGATRPGVQLVATAEARTVVAVGK